MFAVTVLTVTHMIHDVIQLLRNLPHILSTIIAYEVML